MQDPFKITFLAATDGTALTKQYTREGTDNTVTKPYPFVRDFTSFEYEVNTLQDWLNYIIAHSDEGHCFLKGNLDKKLEAEPRAGHTSTNTPTRTILLDLDFNEGFADVEAFLAQLDPMFNDVSYILQHSNSAGITGKKGLRVHLAFLMDKAVDPERLKLWLKYKNLSIPALSNLISLTANGMSIKYPLDITTCQNDKLIYIARPDCVGFEDPLADERTILVRKGKETLSGNIALANPQVVQDLTDEKVKVLRKAGGLKPRKAIMSKGATPILQNPDEAVVTGIKVERKYTYLNLNDGDSWGYFHTTENPDILYNFKGEPNVRLRDIVPVYAAGLATKVKGKGTFELVPMVFRERVRDVYYNMIYNPNTKVIDSLDPVGSKDKMTDFMAQYNKPMPDPVEDWTIEFQPTTLTIVDQQNKWINSFKPSIYMRTEYNEVTGIPYVINKILTSICVDDEYKAWFINWLAYLYQTRAKSGVCPIFHGVQGTGKGLLQEKVLRPLFGEKHTPKVLSQQIADQFNGWQEHAIIATWDEAEQNEMFGANVFDKIKNLVTEKSMTLRLMRMNPIDFVSFINLLIFTNHPYPLPLPIGDRRFSPAPPQLNQIVISLGEVNAIEAELPLFAGFLEHFQVNTMMATHVCMNQAREDMISGSANTVDSFFYALHEGNMDYFLDFQRDNQLTTADPTYNDYITVLRRWANCVGDDDAMVTREEAMAVYSHVIKKFDSPAKFKKMGEKYHFQKCRRRINGVPTRGWKVKWVVREQEDLDEFLKPDVARLKLA